jgi:glycosyltransferase involved in cell wall biosynthesis
VDARSSQLFAPDADGREPRRHRPMKIAVVHSFYSRRQPSGESTVVEHQVALLDRAGYDVRLFSVDTDDLARQPFYRTRAAFRVSTGTGRSPADDIARFRPDVVHVHNLFPNFGTRWLHHIRTPLVTTVHNYRYLCPGGTFTRDGADCFLCPEQGSWQALVHRCYRGSAVATFPLAVASRGAGRTSPVLTRSDTLVTLNGTARKHLSRYVDSTPIEVIPNTVPRPEPTLATSPGHWLYAGRLAPVKGILELLESWPKSEPLVIVGDGPLRSHVVRRSRANEGVTYLGMVDPPTLRRLMSSSFGLVVPSLWSEGLPTVIPECLATGTPVLVSHRVSWTADVDSPAVLTFDPLTAGPLVEAMQRVRQGGQEMRRHSVALYDEYFSPEVWLTSTSSLYEQLTGDQRN